MADEVAQLRMNRRLASRPTNVNPFAALNEFREGEGSNNRIDGERRGKGLHDASPASAEQMRRNNGKRVQSPSLVERMRNVVPGAESVRSPRKDTFYTDRIPPGGAEQDHCPSSRNPSYDASQGHEQQRKQRLKSVTSDGQQQILPAEGSEKRRGASRTHGNHRHPPERAAERPLHDIAEAEHPYIKVRHDSTQSVMALRRKYVLPSSPSPAPYDEYMYTDSGATSPSRPATPEQARGQPSFRSPYQRSSSASYRVAHGHIGSQLGYEAPLSSSIDEHDSTDLFYRGSQRDPAGQTSAMHPGASSHFEEYRQDGLNSRFARAHRGMTRSSSAASSVVSNSQMTITGKMREPIAMASPRAAPSPRTSPLPQWHSSSQGISSANEDLNDSTAARKYGNASNRSMSYKRSQVVGRSSASDASYSKHAQTAQSQRGTAGVLNHGTRNSIAAATAAQSHASLPHPCWVCGRACQHAGYQQLPSIFVEVFNEEGTSRSIAQPVAPLTLCSVCECAVRDAAQSHNRELCGPTENAKHTVHDVNTIASDAFRGCRLTRFSASCSSLFLHCVCRLVAWVDVLYADVKRSVQEEVAELLQYEMGSQRAADRVFAAVEQSGITFPDLQPDVQRILVQRLLQCIESTFQLDTLEHHREHDQELHIKRQEFFNSLKSGSGQKKNAWGPEEWNAAANSSTMISTTALPRSLTRREREMLVTVARSLSSRVACASSALTTTAAAKGPRHGPSSASFRKEEQRHVRSAYSQNALLGEEEVAEQGGGTLRSGAAKRVVRFMMDDVAGRNQSRSLQGAAHAGRSNALQLQSHSALERLADGYTSGYRNSSRQARIQSDVDGKMHEATVPSQVPQIPSQGDATRQELRAFQACAARNAECASATEVDHDDPDNILLRYFEGRLHDLPRFAIPRYIPSPGATAFIMSALMRGGGDSEVENMVQSSAAESSTACTSIAGTTTKEMETVYADLRSPVSSGLKRSPSPAGVSPFLARAAGPAAQQRRPSPGDSARSSPRNANTRETFVGIGNFGFREGRSPSTELLSPYRGWAEYSEIVISDESADEGSGVPMRSARGVSVSERKSNGQAPKVANAMLGATPSSDMDYPQSLAGIVPEPEAAALVAIERARDEERRRGAAEDTLRLAGERIRDLEMLTNDAMEFHLRDHVHYTSAKLVEMEKNFLNSASTFWMEAAMQKSLFFTDAVSSVTRRQEKSYLFERIDLTHLLPIGEAESGAPKLIEAPPTATTQKPDANTHALEEEDPNEGGSVPNETHTNTTAHPPPRTSPPSSSSTLQPLQRITLKPLTVATLNSNDQRAAHRYSSTVETSSSLSLLSAWERSHTATTIAAGSTVPNGTLTPSMGLTSEFNTHQLESDTTIF